MKGRRRRRRHRGWETVASRRARVVPFPVDRARGRERSTYPTLVELHGELERMKAAYITRWNDPAAVMARFIELTRQQGPRALILLIVLAGVCLQLPDLP